MEFDVTFQRPTVRKNLLTKFTLVRGILRVISDYMQFPTTNMGKPFLAIFTQIWFLLCVSSHMFHQVTIFIEPLLAIFTYKRFFLSVNSGIFK